MFANITTQMSRSDGSYTCTSDAGTRQRLIGAFDGAMEELSEQKAGGAPPAGPAMAALHDAAIAFVDRLKAQGLAPEQVIVALKAALRDRDRSEWMPSLDTFGQPDTAHAEPTVYARLFGWCVEAYYREPERLHYAVVLAPASRSRSLVRSPQVECAP